MLSFISFIIIVGIIVLIFIISIVLALFGSLFKFRFKGNKKVPKDTLSHSHSKKIFDKTEGEYVDYEEIDEGK